LKIGESKQYFKMYMQNVQLILLRYVVIAFDEMKIREDLVFDKTTGEITGFVDYGQQSLDQRFATLKEECMKHQPLKQKTVATHMLTIMVRGIFFKLNFPFAHFATTGKCL